jgi:hypothetical protein
MTVGGWVGTVGSWAAYGFGRHSRLGSRSRSWARGTPLARESGRGSEVGVGGTRVSGVLLGSTSQLPGIGFCSRVDFGCRRR